jgi:hypothetical protein
MNIVSFRLGQNWLLVFNCLHSLESLQTQTPEAEFLNEIPDKSLLLVFILAIHSHLCSFALRFLFLQTHGTSYSFYSSVTVHCKGERRKT